MNEEQFYNLNYTHAQLEALLKKIDENEVLTKEQYKQLIEEIGLDNISTFDLNYYNLKNVPPIPVRVSELFNDSGYDHKARVDMELEALGSMLTNEIYRIDELLKDVSSIDIEGTLAKIDTAEERVENIRESIYELNGVIFSFERSIENVENTTYELEQEFSALENMQVADEIRLDNIQQIIQVHTEDIQLLLKMLEAERAKLVEARDILDNVKDEVEKLTDYNGIMHEIDLRVSEIEEFIVAINPEEMDIDAILRITSDIKALQEKDIEFQTQHEAIAKQINDLELDVYSRFESINNIMVELQDELHNTLPIVTDAIEQHRLQLLLHEDSISILDNHVIDINNKINVNIANIEALTQQDIELLTELENINKELERLTVEDQSHHELLKVINEDITNLKAGVESLNVITTSHANDLLDIKEKLSALESWDLMTDIRIKALETDISGNSDKIADINKELEVIDNAFNEVDESLNRIDSDILALSTNFETHHEANEERIKEVDATVEDLNRRIASSEASVLTFQSRLTDAEETMSSLATKEALNSIRLQMHINEQGFVVVELVLEDNIMSTIVIPYNVKFEEQIAKTDHARVDYSRTI